MNFLASTNALIWGLYHAHHGTVQAIPNFAGLACGIVLVIGILYANGVLGENNPLVAFARLWAFLFFQLPKKILSGDMTPEGAAVTPKDEKKKKL